MTTAKARQALSVLLLSASTALASCGQGLITMKSFGQQQFANGPLQLAPAKAWSGYTVVSPYTDSLNGTSLPATMSPASPGNVTALGDVNNAGVVYGTNDAAAAHGRVDLLFNLSGIPLGNFSSFTIELSASGGTSTYAGYCIATTPSGGGGFEVSAYRVNGGPWGTVASFASANSAPSQGLRYQYTVQAPVTPLQDFMFNENPDNTGIQPYLHVSIQTPDVGSSTTVCSVVSVLYAVVHFQ